MDNIEEFDYTSTTNAKSTKTPSLKAINTTAELWMACENAEICGWVKDCECEDGCSHFKNTKPHNLESPASGVINGCVLINPRLLVIGRSPLLKVDKSTSYTVGEWVKGENKKLYDCVRRFLIICLDEENKPLNKVPLQLSAKGHFQMTFDKKLMEFKALMVTCFNKEFKQNFSGMEDHWHAMNIFVPTFQSELKAMMTDKGPSKDKASRACITTSFEVPTNKTWETLTIGNPRKKTITQEQKELTHFVFLEHKRNINWWSKSFKKRPAASPPSSELEFEGVEYE